MSIMLCGSPPKWDPQGKKKKRKRELKSSENERKSETVSVCLSKVKEIKEHVQGEKQRTTLEKKNRAETLASS